MNGAAARRDRPRRDRERGRARGAARRARQQRRDPVADRPRRGRGAGLAPGRAGGPGARVGRARARRRRRLRVGARPRRGHDAHRRSARWPAAWRTTSRTWTRSGSAPTRRAEEQDELLAEVLENALEAGKEAVERGPEQLAVLREAGVVDAGAYGLTVIIAGCLAALRGPTPRRSSSTSTRRRRSTAPSTSRRASATARTSRSPARASRPARFVPRLEELGDSVLVVGDERTLRVHVHTDDPDARGGAVRRRGRGVPLRRGRHARAGGRPHARGCRATRAAGRARHLRGAWRWRAATG